jgi:hypothetical protein
MRTPSGDWLDRRERAEVPWKRHIPSGRHGDVASTRLYFSEVTVIYKEVAPTALLKSEMRPEKRPQLISACTFDEIVVQTY